MTTYILNIAFYDSSDAKAVTGELKVTAIDGSSWIIDLRAGMNIEQALNYINDAGSLISDGCNISLNGCPVGTTEY